MVTNLTMKRLLFVFNPHAGSGKINEHLSEVLNIFTKAGYQVEVYPTQAAGDGTRKILEDGQAFDRIVVAGGDGMLNEMVNGIMHLEKPVTVGYIATGTVNDFARTHNIPKNVLEAAEIAVSDNVKELDVGKFGDRYFAYTVAFGIGSNVPYDTKQTAKKRWKFLAYFVNFLKNIGPNKLKAACRKMTVHADGIVLNGEYAFGTISNSRSIASMPYLVDKSVVLDDGLLECLFIPRPKNRKEWKKLWDNLQARDFYTSDLTFVRAKEIEIHSEKTNWCIDGENGGTHEHIVISAEQKALKIALPKPIA